MYGVVMMFKLLFLSFHFGCEGKRIHLSKIDPNDHHGPSDDHHITDYDPSDDFQDDHLRNLLVNPMVKKVLLPRR